MYKNSLQKRQYLVLQGVTYWNCLSNRVSDSLESFLVAWQPQLSRKCNHLTLTRKQMYFPKCHYSFKVPNISVSTTTYTPKSTFAWGCKVIVLVLYSQCLTCLTALSPLLLYPRENAWTLHLLFQSKFWIFKLEVLYPLQNKSITSKDFERLNGVTTSQKI